MYRVSSFAAPYPAHRSHFMFYPSFELLVLVFISECIWIVMRSLLTCVCDKQMHSVGHDLDVSVCCEFHKHPTVVIAVISSQVLATGDGRWAMGDGRWAMVDTNEHQLTITTTTTHIQYDD
uniref:Uncharacterized protein n=1 Tax=Glossina brevipalpis TaxID=37001 RepID=A0A1A9WA84_9MUSC